MNLALRNQAGYAQGESVNSYLFRRVVCDAVKILADPPAGGLPEAWARFGSTVSREQLAAAVATVNATTRPATDTRRGPAHPLQPEFCCVLKKFAV